MSDDDDEAQMRNQISISKVALDDPKFGISRDKSRTLNPLK
jgi:hypothetical protein